MQSLRPITRILTRCPTCLRLPPLRAIHHLPPTTFTISHKPLATYLHLHRRYAQTLSSSSSPSSGPVTGTPPDLAALSQDEFWKDEQVKLVPEEKAELIVTADAVKQLSTISSRESHPSTLALRLAVESGGCHGYQYLIELTEERGVDDYVFSPGGEGCLPIVVDLVSLNLLKGSTLHFATELIGSSFRIEENPQAKEGGACGCGVSWEAKD